MDLISIVTLETITFKTNTAFSSIKLSHNPMLNLDMSIRYHRDTLHFYDLLRVAFRAIVNIGTKAEQDI